MNPSVPAVLIVDLEVNPKSRVVFKLGAYRPDLARGFEQGFRSPQGFREALAQMADLADGAKWLMGHNIIAHDLPYLLDAAPDADAAWLQLPVIDTLRLSPLAFPQNPYHRLIKNHKIISSSLNSPEADCRACWQLFQDQCVSFGKMRLEQPQEFAVYGSLVGALPYCSDGLMVIPENYGVPEGIEQRNHKAFMGGIWEILKDDTAGNGNTENPKGRLKVCQTRFKKLMSEDIYRPALYAPLAYALSWLRVSGGNSVLAPWVRHQFPDTARLIEECRDRDCGRAECGYCADTLNPQKQLQHVFSLPSFRDVKGIAGGQEAIVKAGMQGRHVLAVLPTGGGKSLCYQLPAVNRYRRNGGLTIVVSPLQSLMKDQADGMAKRGISGAAMLNGMQPVTVRADVLDKVALGDVGILFVAPEQFRNGSFIKAIEHRQINGWVFDEAHCLSKWGHDFRPDYLYAAKFIAARREKTGHLAPVSCFTATAKPDVLQDITGHFREELGIEFTQFIGGNERDNLFYDVLEVSDDLKRQQIDQLLHRELDHQEGGAVVFVSRRKSAEAYAEYLKKMGWECEHFHAGLQQNAKAEVQDSFLKGSLRVIVATNAFGMGVDKPDVRLVVHAEITGSLENYLQEAGRAGRDQKNAKCVLLYDRNDVDVQFRISRASQIEPRDLKSVWRKLKFLNTAYTGKTADGDIVVTGGEILRDTEEYMSFDSDDRQADTKVKTAVSWLERAGMLARTENQTRVFPARSSRLNLEQAVEKIKKADLPQRKRELYQTITEIVFNAPDDEPLSTDVLAAATACSFTELRGHLKALEELGILTNDTKMTVNLRTDNVRPSEKRLAEVIAQEEKLWQILHDEIPEADRYEWQNFSLTAACHQMHEAGFENLLPADIKQMMYALADDKAAVSALNSGSFNLLDHGGGSLKVRFKNRNDSWEDLRNNAALRRRICQSVLPFLTAKTDLRAKDVIVETSTGELVRHIGDDLTLAGDIIETRREALLNSALLYMHKLGIIKLNHGMTILRHAMTIRLDKQALAEKRQYLKADYRPLEVFYGEKRFQIHVMQEYALRALKSIESGLELVRDYFQTQEEQFKNKWFKGRLNEIKEPVSPETYSGITDGLNAQQKAVVTDQSTRNRLVLAGPGSGKTRVIVHRVAYLLKVCHADPASIIVLTFNRLAAQEIKRRLFALAGSIAAAVTVLTYDGMAMRLLGVRFDGKKRPSETDTAQDRFKQWCNQSADLLTGSLAADGADDARDRIMAGFRYILVDEYQDISEEQYRLVSALAGRQADEDDKLTILAVGDDDQNIYTFRDTSSEYIHRFRSDYGVDTFDYLTLNYRSTQNIVTAANRLIQSMEGRLKALHPIAVNPERQAQPNGGAWADKDPERLGRVRIIRLPNGGSRKQRANIQAQAVMAELERLKQIGGFGYGDAAVLARQHDELKPLQAWCEQHGIPYFLSKERKNSIRLNRTREFVRLLDALDKAQTAVSAQDFAQIIRSQKAKSAGRWPETFELMAQDFCREYPVSDDPAAEPPAFAAAFLKNWLYEYVGSDSENRADGLFLGTAHSAKGLEFKHVFVADGGWTSAAEEEQRLYYVAMTRAVETLTLIQTAPRHAWIEKLSDDVAETVTQHFAPLPELDTEYRVLSVYGELDVGFIARDERCFGSQPHLDNVRQKLKAASALQLGDELEVRYSDGRYQFLAGNTVVAQTARKTDLPKLEGETTRNVRAFVSAFSVRYRDEEEESFRKKIPGNLEKWPVVIPMLVIAP